ncbi:MAG TPA: cupin domain-containing protein [Thermoleophilaceae bacterium]|nr:cupin domain-containing protein [Thermoleophilaceae bacterium]
METINGCTVIPPVETPDPIPFGPAQTGAAYVVLSGIFPPGEPGPPPHVHPHTDEAFYLAEGEATFLLGDHEVEVSAGALVFVPRGAVHTVWNSGDTPIRGLILISPGDAEHELVPAPDS